MAHRATLTDLQDAAVQAMDLAWSKVGPRTTGHRYERSVGAAYRKLVAALVKRGYNQDAAKQIAKDAHDIHLLNRCCDCDD